MVYYSHMSPAKPDGITRGRKIIGTKNPDAVPVAELGDEVVQEKESSSPASSGAVTPVTAVKASEPKTAAAPKKAAASQATGEPSLSRPVLVEFKDVSKRYGSHVVLDRINLKLYKGEFLSLVGPSGAGKSTLIKCLTLQEWPDEGRIMVAGQDITVLKRSSLPHYRRKLGFVFQDYKLLPTKTVYENISFALEVCNVPNREIADRVKVMLDTVGMATKGSSFPKELSGGEQQRVAIARALVHDPKILIADEPTGNLDPVNTWEIIELLYKINRAGTMVILATHDREIVDTLQKRVVTIRAGQIVADQEKGMYLV